MILVVVVTRTVACSVVLTRDWKETRESSARQSLARGLLRSLGLRSCMRGMVQLHECLDLLCCGAEMTKGDGIEASVISWSSVAISW